MAKIIGLAGPGKVGKSTTANALSRELAAVDSSLKIIRYAFASPIYTIASTLTGLSVSDLKNEKTKEVPWTAENAPMPCLIGWHPRKFLQIIGTECFRDNVSQNFWVEATLQYVKNFDIAIIEDARFDNEFELCDLVIELERDGVEYAKNHPSAMPPNPKYVWEKIHLTPGISFTNLAQSIITTLKEKGL